MKLLDTDTCIGLLKGDPHVVECWRKCMEQCALPAMVIGELYYGASKSVSRKAETERVDHFVQAFKAIAPTVNSMRKFGEIKGSLEAAGTRLADADLIIASTALDSAMTLVTGNTSHYARIDGLSLENWFGR